MFTMFWEILSFFLIYTLVCVMATVVVVYIVDPTLFDSKKQRDLTKGVE
jgi:hypothetical protein